MRVFGALAFALLGTASPTPGQRFGFTHQMLPAEARTTRALVLGDVDGDGDLDAFVAYGSTYLPEHCRLQLNDGAGAFTDVTAANLPTAVNPAHAVALGDVDGDGDLDAFVGNSLEEDRLYLNDGAGAFADAPATNLPSSLGYTTAVALGDVDGDGDLDAYIGRRAGALGAEDRLYLNDGTGTFTDATAGSLPPVVDETGAVALGDLDGDGDLDAFVGNWNQPDRLYLNGSTGVFADATVPNLPPALDVTRAVALGDVDGDGDLDLFVGNDGPDRLSLNNGAAVFSNAPAGYLPPLGESTQAVVLRDVDGDGDLDAFLGSGILPVPQGFGQQNRLYRNLGGGAFADVTSTALPAASDLTTAVAMGDVDGDGDIDALVGNLWEQDRLYLNDGTGSFAEATTGAFPSALDWTAAVVLGDVDGDGDLDAFFGNIGEPDRLYLNVGPGSFAGFSAANLPPLSDSTYAVALGDVDGDGDLDAYLGNIGTQDRLLLNDGAGTFLDVTAGNLPPLNDYTFAVALGDVDGDGDLDAFVGNTGLPYGQQNRLHLNAGTGLFTDVTATNLPAILEFTQAVALGDMDADGDLDAFVGNQGQDRLYLNGGSGVFIDAGSTYLSSPPDGTGGVALGDVDGDGDLDAFLGNWGQDRLYRNNGSGVYTDATATNLPSILDQSTAVALGDVDGDGDLDAFVGNFGQQDRLYRNDGSGVFTDATPTDLPAVSDLTEAVALGDVDGDGDLDSVCGALGQDRLYTNLTHQLAWRAIPRAGKPLVLDLHGPAWGAWFLGLALGTASVPIPPFGTLRIDPTLTFPPLGGIFDAEGRATVTNAVPANPALVGSTLYWQALVVGAGFPRFTNLEVTTVTNL